MQRRKLVNEKRIEEYDIKKKQYDTEQREDELNALCESRLIELVMSCSTTDLQVLNENQSDIDFQLVRNHLTLSLLQDNLSKVKNNKLKAFIKVRSERSLKRGKISFRSLPTNKDLLIKKCIEVKDLNRTARLCSMPVYPSILPIDE